MANRILTADQVAEIKAAGALRLTLSNKHLALRFGVSPDHIKNVIHNEVCRRRKQRERERRLLANTATVTNTATVSVQKP
jgi:hypothetical protein